MGLLFTPLDEAFVQQDVDDVNQRFFSDVYRQGQVLLTVFHETSAPLSVHGLGQFAALTNHSEVGLHVTIVG